MVAWHAEPELKIQALAQLREHQRMDQIVQGTYWKDGKGCHLGCLTHCNVDSHEATERLFGLPLRVAYFLEAVFEGLPKDKAVRWVTESVEAIPVGADLSRWHHRFGHWLLAESGLLTITDINRDAIAGVAELHRRAAAGEPLCEAAESAAWSSAAWSAAAAAESAAWSSAAEWSAAWSAAAASESAGESAGARSAARSAAFEKFAAKAIELFASSPVAAVCTECPDAAAKSILHLKSTRLVRV